MISPTLGDGNIASKLTNGLCVSLVSPTCHHHDGGVGSTVLSMRRHRPGSGAHMQPQHLGSGGPGVQGQPVIHETPSQQNKVNE